MMFTTEFYRLADELAAELERLKGHWGEGFARPRLRRFRFRNFSAPGGATALSVDFGTPQPYIPLLPSDAVVKTADLEAYVPGKGWRRWNNVDFTYGRDVFFATVAGDGEPLPMAEGCIREAINREVWSDYGEWHEVIYE